MKRNAITGLLYFICQAISKFAMLKQRHTFIFEENCDTHYLGWDRLMQWLGTTDVTFKCGNGSHESSKRSRAH